MTTNEEIAIDLATETIRLFGIRYSFELFRVLAFSPLGAAFRIIGREDGIVTLESVASPEGFDANN